MASDCDETKATKVEYKQTPVITSVYSDPETKQMKCLVLVLLFSDIKNVEFDVVLGGGNEQLFKITYLWPKSSFEVSEMFKKEGVAEPFVNKIHPKFLSTKLARKFRLK